ncbi:MAG: glycoside hydrolase family 18 protein [Cytophagales bacterium]
MRFKNYILSFVASLSLMEGVAQEGIKSGELQAVNIKSECKHIIGYYPSWEQYKRNGVFATDNVKYKLYTVINYAFFAPDSLGNLAGTDAWGDSILLRGRFDFSAVEQPAYIPNTSLIDLAHSWGVKVMVSIGGWTLSENFPKIAADPKKRANFAHECVKVLRVYKFDGIDIDWEFPGYEEHKGGPEDKKNFTLLMKEIRDSIDNYGEKIKKYFYLSAAFGANESNMVHIEWDEISNTLDMINMMTYDFNGIWSDDANHNSPLYNPAEGYVGSLDHTYNVLTTQYKVPPHKINLGAAFYGRSLMGKKNGEKLTLHSKNETKYSDTITFVPDEGGVLYYNILLNKHKFEEKWDSVAQVPYLVGKNINTFVSFDNEKSIRLKAEYIKSKKLAGVIIWEMSGDFIEKKPGTGFVKGFPLAEILYEVLDPCPLRPIRRRFK